MFLMYFTEAQNISKARKKNKINIKKQINYQKKNIDDRQSLYSEVQNILLTRKNVKIKEDKSLLIP